MPAYTPPPQDFPLLSEPLRPSLYGWELEAEADPLPQVAETDPLTQVCNLAWLRQICYRWSVFFPAKMDPLPLVCILAS